MNYYEDLKFYKKLFERGVLRPIDENYTIYSDIISTELNRAILNGSPSSILIDRIIKILPEHFQLNSFLLFNFQNVPIIHKKLKWYVHIFSHLTHFGSLKVNFNILKINRYVRKNSRQDKRISF